MTNYVLETEALISAVRNRPAIWDKRLEDHSNRYLVAERWKEVSKEMNQPEKALRSRWKYLREHFLSILKDEFERPDNPRSHTIWKFYDKLTFLKDIFEPWRRSLFIIGDNKSLKEEVERINSSSKSPTTFVDSAPMSEPEESEDDEHLPEPEFEELSNLVEQTSSQTQQTTSFVGESLKSSSPFVTTTTHNRKRRRVPGLPNDKDEARLLTQLVDLEEKKVNILMNKSRTKISETDTNTNTNSDSNLKSDFSLGELASTDEDVLFLKSLLPHMKLIPQHVKLVARSRIQSVIAECALYPNSSSHPLPTSIQEQQYTVTSL